MSIKYNEQEIKEKLSSKETYDFFNKYGIKNVLIFGSIIRSEFNDESDVDLAVTADNNITLDSILDIEIYLQNLLNREIDVIDLNNPALDLFLKINILNNGVLIYSTDNRETLECIYNKTDRLYKENENFIYFRRLDVLS